jgi:hypothetical protein
MKQITIEGNTYKSISAAWRAESPQGLPQITVRWRLNNDWDAYNAFKTLPVAERLRRVWKDHRLNT